MSRGSSSWRHTYWGSPCSPHLETVELGRATLRVDHRIVAAVEALRRVLVVKHGYDVHPEYPKGDTGAYNCRHIGNDPNRPWSSHSWATAIDINWNTNPDGNRLRTNIPRAAIDDIHQIKTRSGAPVWRWGGDWDRDPRTGHSYYDAMHFEIHATPAELATGIVLPGTVQPEPGPEPEEYDVKPYLVKHEGAVWIVAADLSSRTKVATPTDLNALQATNQTAPDPGFTSGQIEAVPDVTVY